MVMRLRMLMARVSLRQRIVYSIVVLVIVMVTWETSDENLEEIGARLDAMRHFPLLSARQVASLARVDKRSYVAGFIGSNWAGLYKPKR